MTAPSMQASAPTAPKSGPDVIALLRQRLQPLGAFGPLADGAADRWGTGVPEVDALLPAHPLSTPPRPAAGLHEIKPAAYPDRAAAAGFALTLLARRLAEDRRPVLWVLPATWRREHGTPYGPGLAALGLATDRCTFAETRTRAETLWALEEGVRSGALAAVLGILDVLEITPARRLVLAATSTPCFALTDARTPGVPAAHSRWRVQAATAPPEFAREPAEWCGRLILERCRQGCVERGPARSTPEDDRHSWLMEWCDASFRLRLSPGLAHPPLVHPGPPLRQAGAG